MKISQGPEEVKPRKPAGAVSMFGGMDPTSILKKRRQVSEGDEEEGGDAGTKRETGSAGRGAMAKQEPAQLAKPSVPQPS